MTTTSNQPNEVVKELNNILFRFALIDTEQSYERFLEQYLDIVISKLNINDESVKKKVMEVLSNINKRSMVTSNIQFPISKLLSLYNDSQMSMVVKNFAIVYIEKGFKSLSSDSKVPYLTEIATNINKIIPIHQDIFCHIILSILISINISKNDKEKLNQFSFLNNENDVKILLSFFYDFLITPVIPKDSKEIPPCHSVLSLQRILGKTLNKYDFNQLCERKLAILNLLSIGILDDTTIFPLILVASVDSIQDVQKKAEDMIKRLSKVKFDDKSLTDRLFQIFMGTSQISGNLTTGSNQQQQQQVDSIRKEASPLLKEKILNYFCKSVPAANSFPLTLKVIFDSIYGVSTTMKLKHAAMAFVQWVFRMSTDQELYSMSKTIYEGLLKLIEELDQSGISGNKDINDLKAFTYSSLGLLCKREKSLFKNDVQLVNRLLKKMNTEEPMVVSSIQDSLVMIREAFVDPPKEIGDQLIEILMSFLHGDQFEYQIRTVIVQWAQHCFPFDDVRSRYISLVFSGDVRPDIREESRRGLEPYVHQGNMLALPPSDSSIPPKYPDFKELLDYLVEKRQELTQPVKGSKVTNKLQGALSIIGFNSLSYENMLILLRTCLRRSSLSLKLIPSKYLSTLSQETIAKYQSFIEVGLETKIGDDVQMVSAISLLQLMNLNEQSIPTFINKLALIDKLLKSSKPTFKDLYSKMIGLLSIHFNTNEQKQQLKEMIQSFMKQIELSNDVVEIYGPMSSLSYIIANFSKSNLINNNNTDDNDGIINKSFIKKYIDLIFKKFIDHNNQAIKLCTIQSIGLSGCYKPLPIDDNEKSVIVTKLISIVKNTASSERHVSEAAIHSLGYICFGENQFNEISSFKKQVIDSLFELVNNKNEELQFTIGETLSLIIGGNRMKQSIYPFSPFTIEEIQLDIKQQESELGQEEYIKQQQQQDVEMKDSNEDETKNNNIIIEMFNRILSTYFSDRQSPITRCSAGIYMVCLLKNFGKLECIQQLLPLVQNGFISLLSDNNELTQDIASKGITLCYDSSIDPKFREFLVSNLSKTLSGKPAQKAPGSSELLPEGAVSNKTGSVLTYKELTSVANDLGKPDMVYKLMNLSSHHQIWNSKKGASFAIVSLASKAKDELAPLLPHLIPKIYRFVYDPNPKMAQSMKNIMNALIDQKDIFPQFFVPIMKEIIQGMGTNSWRVREASCLAIPDTITHATPEELLPFLEELFYMSFRTLDDIKESVRKAAEIAMKSIGNVSARLCDPSYTSTSKAKEIIKLILPFLLQKGINNDSNDVKQFSIQQLVKISKSSKDLLIPFIPDMVTVILESLSNLENAAFNYASFHAESMNVSQEQIESMRVEISKNSPLNDILEICQRYIDDSNITQVLANLNQLVQFSVGIVTRVGIAKFISALFQSKTAPINDLPEPTLIKLLNTMFPSINNDKSPVLKRYFIQATSFVLNKSSTKIVKSTLDKVFGMVSIDVDSDKLEGNLATVGVVFKEFYKNCSVKISIFQKDIIPFLYFYKCHPKKEISDIYKSIWEDNSIGSIKMYTDEIIQLISTNMNSGTWSTKEQAALCLSCLTDDIRNMIDTHLPMVLSLIVQGLKGRTYPGKDSLLGSLSTLSTVCASTIRSPPEGFKNIPKPEEIVNIMFGECKKNDLEYKRKAITNLSIILKSFNDVDIYDKCKEEFYPFIFIENEQQDEEMKDSDKPKEEIDKEELKLKPLKVLIRSQIYNVIGDSFKASSKHTKLQNLDLGNKLLGNLVSSLWSEQVSILYALSCFFKSIWSLDGVDPQSDQFYLSNDKVNYLFKTIAETLDYTKFQVVKKSCLDLLEDLVLVGGSKFIIIKQQFDKIKILITESSKKDNTIGVQVDKLLLLLK